MDILIVGGGAAGFFAAVTCAEANPAARVTILERSQGVLQKVKISGGGRCNVTHACFDPGALVQFYPRGNRELLGPFRRFGPQDTVEWFERRGVRLKTEPDGRIFPASDQSQTIIDCLMVAARNTGVTIQTGRRVEGLQREEARWKVLITRDAPVFADRILVATGSSEPVWEWLARLGHTIVPPVPSLFTFNTRDTRLRDLSGISVPAAILSVPTLNHKAEGPLLITHWGLSGPAVLRLSAWGARDMHSCGYDFDLLVNWTSMNLPETETTLLSVQKEQPRKLICSGAQFGLPLRLWQNLCTAAGVPPTMRWADLNKKTRQKLSEELVSGRFTIHGKSTFKEEFVTAGGVDLREIDFRSFSSKIQPNLFLAGEVLDIDALTGGFNFQAAWTGGYLAGLAMAL